VTDVAIVGLACRFPGADNPTTFWRNLCAGVDSISFFADDELRAAGVSPALLAHPGYVKAAAVLADADRFDAAFFGFSPREATLLDPQQRLFLEVTWEAFEDAGYHPESYDGVAGVFAGGGGVVTSYLFAHAGHPSFDAATASLSHLGNDKDFLATRVSYKLNLTGPSLTVQTACSTSLVAVHLACQSLLAGECDMALAGAATVRIPQIAGYLAEKGNVYSLDGRCRAFDASGQGTIFGSGVAAVLLKKVEAAVASGDHIYAVIKGTAVNNDGGRKVSYPSPSVTGQARAMVEAFTLADCSPDTVRYVECHATGTAVGDPQEVQALTRAFRAWTARSGFCAVGSVKTNIGHPEQTAGLAGLIKTVLALRHRRIPPSLHFVTPNPKIEFVTSPFFVNTELREWPADPHPRRAGVNSLGIGGTNAFVVLEEAPARDEDSPDDVRTTGTAQTPGGRVLTLSTKTEAALSGYVERIAAFLDSDPAATLDDLTYTSNISRSQLPYRFAITAATVADLRSNLATVVSGAARAPVVNARGTEPRIAMLFSGQGSQYAGMGAALYRQYPVFREALDRCAAALRGHLDRPLLDILFAEGAGAPFLDETRYTQPALAAVELALAEMWRAWGVQPSAVLGHSVGEFAAACVAGVLSPEDALALVAERGRLMQELPADGAMVAVLAPEDAVRDALATASGPVAIAAVNAPAVTVVSGAVGAVRGVVARLEAAGVRTRPLRVSHAFHSPLMDPILERLERATESVKARSPEIPLVSNVTGKVVDAIPGGAYWRAHARESVRFADGLRTLRGLGAGIFMEIGPGGTLVALGRQALDDAAAATWLTTLPRREGELAATTEGLARLYLNGVTIDWREVQRGTSARRVSMPTYPFQRKRYWLDRVSPSSSAPSSGRDLAIEPAAAPTPDDTHPLLGRATLLDGNLSFETAWGVERLPYLRDHRIGGALILPTAMAVEAGLAAGRAHFGAQAMGMEGLVYHEVLRFREGDECRVRVTLMPVAADRANFSLASLTREGSWRAHVTGVVAVLTSDHSPGADQVGMPRCGRVIAPDHFYAALRSIGLDYGASFRGICELRQGQAAAVSRVRLPAVVAPDGYGIHPAFLDACLHAFPAVLDQNGRGRRDSDTTYLPVSIERARVYRDTAVEATVSTVLRPETKQQRGPIVDIRVVDEAGRPIATVEGLSLRPLRADRLGEDDSSDAPALYHVQWEVRARSAAIERTSHGSGAWLVFAGADGAAARCAAELRRRGEHCHIVSPGRSFTRKSGPTWTIDPRRPEHFRRLLGDVARWEPLPLHGSLFLWPTETGASETLTVAELERAEACGAGAALFLVQALVSARSENRDSGKVWFVTRNAQRPAGGAGPLSTPQSLLWGLGRTVALEAPAIWGGLVDLSPAGDDPANEAVALAAEMFESDGENQIALRGGMRYVARLKALVTEEAPVRRGRFRTDGTYLITGGLGMLGLRTAYNLVESHGVRSLVLVGRRRPMRRGQATALAALRARGARVRVVAADIAREADVRRVLRSMRGLPPLRGVFHGAGVLDDAVLARMTWSQFTRVTAAKVRGSWLLHRHTRALPLDFFVLHSSLLSMTGSAGQANYTAANAFLDALVDHRRALGLPATGFNWGPWAEAGMARSTGGRGEAMWRARGVRYLAPETAVAALNLALRRGLAHVAMAAIDWPTFVAELPAGGAPFYANVHATTAGSGVTKLARAADAVTDRLRRAGPGDRRGIVLEVVRRHVMTELGFEEPIDTRQPLSELGLDSLMSVNVANRLEAALGMPVPVIKLIRGPSIEHLVDSLVPGLDGAMPSSGTDARAVRPEPTEASVGSAILGDGWIVVPRRRPSALLRLICFPFAGAGAAPFRSWADALHPSIELVAIEPPGRASRIHEPPERDLERFFADLTRALAPVLDRPAAFFGHCLGGLIAWETARRLRQRGHVDLRAFFVAGVRPPHRLTHEGDFEHTLLERMLRHETFDPLRPAHEQPDEVFAEITRHFNIDATDEFLAQPELRRLLLPTVRADFALTAAYRYEPEPPWDVPVTCFAGLDDPYVSREDADGWSDYTRRSFRLHWRPGAHFLVVDDRDFIIQTLNRELTA